MKEYGLLIVGLGALALMTGLNLRHAVNSYRILDNNLAIEVLAQSGSSGRSSNSNGGSSGNCSGTNLWDWNCQSGSRSNPYPSGKAGHTRSCQLNLGGEYTLWDR